MAKRRRPPVRGGAGTGRVRSSMNGGGAGKVLLGVLLGGAAVAGAGYLYLHTARGGKGDRPGTPGLTVPSAGESRPKQQARPPSAAPGDIESMGIASERHPPFGASEDVFEAGASVYFERCAKCHGTVRRDAAGASGQRAVQLFRDGRSRASAQTPGQVFAAINLGAQGLGMPAYHGILTEPQIWQIVLLLRSAAGPLPDPVVATLDGR